MSLGDKLRENPLLPLFWLRSIFLRRFVYPIMDRKEKFRVLDEDWNCLIVLDACRYDTFEKYYREYIDVGVLEKRNSVGTETTTFLLENFGGDFHDDIVYITANPFVDRLLAGKFHRIIPVWKFGWDDELNTVPPWTTFAYALRAIRKYKDKRFVVHFIQPHFPFIPIKLEDRTFEELRNAVLEGRSPRIKNTKRSLYRISSLDLYVEFDEKTLMKAYEANLKITLPFVAKLIDIMPGKVVVTADHGETFGERLHKFLPIRVYGHPPNVPMRELFEVPWLVVDKDESLDVNKEFAKVRRRIKKDEIKSVIGKIRKKL